MKNLRLKILLAVLAASLALWLATPPLRLWVAPSNFHAVLPGVVYRSAQMNGDVLETQLTQNHIRSVLNLRGEEKGAAWYDEELSLSQKLGVIHYDYRLSATEKVTPKEIDEIFDILRSAPKPILIHCQAGADRTGLICALYMYKIVGESPEKAAQSQLSILFGHNTLLNPATHAMDDSFWDYVRTTR